jgi:S-adenosylmethionine:tRNA ribosyltransferase-isomerase
LRVDAFHYDLPPELIAQRPVEERERARLMHVPASGGPPEHRHVADLPSLLEPGTLVVLNDTRVVPARLHGRKVGTGGHVEVFLVRPLGEREIEIAPGERRVTQAWRALGRSSKPFRFGTDVEVTPRDGAARADLRVRLLGRAEEDGLLEVALWTVSGSPVGDAVQACGHVPLPPYIRRDDSAEDVARYQTVYARHDGAVAAPTAGLHLTDALLERLRARQCAIATLTLHVGLGTFQPVQVDDLDDHPMHSERFVVGPEAVEAVAQARARRARVVAVGTTTARALESAADPGAPGHLRAASEETELLIQPGYRWQVVDGLLTNFHLPSSTLLALVSAFAGHERTLDAYRSAVEAAYRFFSYGDAMLLWRAA